MRKIIDLTGQKFGRLTAISFSRKKPYGNLGKTSTMWNCVCDCGLNAEVSQSCLASGDTSSCGCYQKECAASIKKSHGKVYTSTYTSWRGIGSRCSNPRDTGFKNYGGRGISVCERWLSFENFIADMGERPSSKHSLDRIDTNGDYTPNNCRWATARQQADNKRTTIRITHNSVTKTLVEWAAHLGMPRSMLYYRLFIHNWPVDKAFTLKKFSRIKMTR